jgi:hypothetical protein
MILRKDYVKLIQEGKAQVEVEKTEEHNEMLNLIFPKRHKDQVMIRGFYKVSGGEEEYTCCGDSFHNLPTIHASDIILDNTVIKVESKEHGKRVIEWWKGQGVNTRNLSGQEVGCYYGIFKRSFYYFDDKGVFKVITLPETFPSKWYLKITNENKEVANEWRRSVARTYLDVIPHDGEIIISEPYKDGSYYLAGDSQKVEVFNLNLKEISLEQFLKHVYAPWKNRLIEGQEIIINEIKQENKMEKIIKWTEAQELIDMVSNSCEWKGKLLDLWAVKIVLKEQIKVGEELLQQGRKEASQSQKEVIDKIFGKEKEEISLGGIMIKNDYIQLREGGEHKGKALVLSENYNWEIKKDNYNFLCLIPTHKE